MTFVEKSIFDVNSLKLIRVVFSNFDCAVFSEVSLIFFRYFPTCTKFSSKVIFFVDSEFF